MSDGDSLSSWRRYSFHLSSWIECLLVCSFCLKNFFPLFFRRKREEGSLRRRDERWEQEKRGRRKTDGTDWGLNREEGMREDKSRGRGWCSKNFFLRWFTRWWSSGSRDERRERTRDEEKERKRVLFTTRVPRGLQQQHQLQVCNITWTILLWERLPPILRNILGKICFSLAKLLGCSPWMPSDWMSGEETRSAFEGREERRRLGFITAGFSSILLLRLDSCSSRFLLFLLLSFFSFFSYLTLCSLSCLSSGHFEDPSFEGLFRSTWDKNFSMKREDTESMVTWDSHHPWVSLMFPVPRIQLYFFVVSGDTSFLKQTQNGFTQPVDPLKLFQTVCFVD